MAFKMRHPFKQTETTETTEVAPVKPTKHDMYGVVNEKGTRVINASGNWVDINSKEGKRITANPA